MSSLISLPTHPDLLIFFIGFLLETAFKIYQQVEFVMAESRVDRRLRFLRSGINANFTITCKDREWRVDRGILAAESDYFQTLCLGDFSEASECKVSFPEEEPEVIDQVLVYLYTGAYDDLAVVAAPDEDTTTSEASVQSKNASEYEASQDGGEPSTDVALSQAYTCLDLAVSTSAWTVKFNYAPVAALDSAGADTVTEVLKTGIMVYRCAKMINLPELKFLAFQRILEKEQYFLKSDFADVLTTLYHNTESDDRLLRLKLTARCVENHFVLKEKCGDAVGVLEECETCSWEIGVEQLIARNLARELYREEAHQHSLTRSELEDKTDELDRSDVKLTETLNDVSSIKHDWDRLPWNCCSCGRDMSTSRFIMARGPKGRPQIMCRCNRKYECGQGLY